MDPTRRPKKKFRPKITPRKSRGKPKAAGASAPSRKGPTSTKAEPRHADTGGGAPKTKQPVSTARPAVNEVAVKLEPEAPPAKIPKQSAVDAAAAATQEALAAAKASYERVATGAAEVIAARSLGEQGTKQASDVPLRIAVSRAARDEGVAISRIQPVDDGGLTVWVESVSAPLMYRWISQLASAHGVAPAKVIAQKSTVEGRLRVQLQFGAPS